MSSAVLTPYRQALADAAAKKKASAKPNRAKVLHPYTAKAVRITLDVTAFTEEQLFSRARTNELVMARAYVYLILRHFHKWTLQRIADEFCKDHGTVLSSLRKLNELYETDRHYRMQITHVLQRAVTHWTKVEALSV